MINNYSKFLSDAELLALQTEIISVARMKKIRKLYGLTQKKFAELINIKYDTLRSWEGGYRYPASPGRALLYLAEKSPETFLKDKDQILAFTSNLS